MDRIVGIGEFAVSDKKDDVIKTFALSTCVAVAVYSPLRNVAGMVHVALPSPASARDDDQMRPCYYASTGVPYLINKMCSEFGCLKGELMVELFGGAMSVRNNDIFKIGTKNINTVKEILNVLNIKYRAIEIGGICSRTLAMDVATGKINVIMQPITI
ncbi:MAG: archease [Clostridia bacterium BRH_c25]|nr:MAG: archease [Clostridia bacterium BRH_c25]